MIYQLRKCNYLFICVSCYIKLCLVIVLPVIFGCAYRNSAYRIINPQLQTSASDDGEVNITVKAQTWVGSPENLGSYITPFYIELQNNSDKTLSFGYEDFVIFDESRNQYNVLTLQMVSSIIVSKARKKYYFYPSISIGIGTGFYHGGYRYHGYPYYYEPYFFGYYPGYNPGIYYITDYGDIFTQALIPGLIYPNARLSGFVYFKNLPHGVRNFTFDVGYKIEEDEKRYVLSFPFTIEAIQ